MAIELMTDKWTNKIHELKIGATAKDGGTRDYDISLGGEDCMPLLKKEATSITKPRISFEILDIEPTEWSDALKKPFGQAINNPVEWAKFCVEKLKAELITLRLQGTHPDYANKTADDAAKLVKELLGAVKVPLIILGCGDDDKDNQVLPKCSEAAKGERCLIGDAITNNYKTLALSCLADGHNIIAESPIDINMAKQLNILISDMGMDVSRIAINPTIGALGYGMEYAYSIMERARLAALGGDSMLACPFVCFVGHEAWRAKEAKTPDEDLAITWEIATATSMLLSGADLLIMRHPNAIAAVTKYINDMN